MSKTFCQYGVTISNCCRDTDCIDCTKGKELEKGMIDGEKLKNYIKSEINPYGKPFEGTAYEFGLKLMDYIDSMEKTDLDKKGIKNE